MRFSLPWFWVWPLVYALFVVLSVVSLSLRSSVARYALAGSILVAFLVADPLLSAWSGNPWYLVFLLPELDTSLYADDPFLLAMYVRSLVLWSLYRIGIIAAIVLAVPDPRGTAGAVPRGASSVPAQGIRAHGGDKWEGVGENTDPVAGGARREARLGWGGASVGASRRSSLALWLMLLDPSGKVLTTDAGWSSSVARRAHNPEVAGSNPVPATTIGPVPIGTGPFVSLASRPANVLTRRVRHTIQLVVRHQEVHFRVREEYR